MTLALLMAFIFVFEVVLLKLLIHDINKNRGVEEPERQWYLALIFGIIHVGFGSSIAGEIARLESKKLKNEVTEMIDRAVTVKNFETELAK